MIDNPHSENAPLDKGALVFQSSGKKLSAEAGLIALGFVAGLFFVALAVVIYPTSWGMSAILDFFVYFVPPMALGIAIPILTYHFAIVRCSWQKVTLYENRLDFEEGVFSKTQRSIWLYQVQSVVVTSSPIDTVTRNKRISVYSTQGIVSFSGVLGKFDGATKSEDVIEKLRTYIVDHSVTQRYAVKGRLT